jgi:glycosyltransferase involved in cell wall biosynthesis
MLSVVIPARNEMYLPRTIQDILEKSHTDIEIIIVMDDDWRYVKEIPKDERVTIVHTPRKGMRYCINMGVALAKGEYLMKCDAHVLFADGFDEQLINDYEEKTFVIPTRKRLDPVKWEVKKERRADINYMYLKNNRGVKDGKKNRDPSLEKDRIIETTAFQGSCWFTKKSFYEEIGGEDDVNFGGNGHEAQEIYYKAKYNGGRILRNKNTWYAHWHKNIGTSKIDVMKSRLYLPTLIEKLKKIERQPPMDTNKEIENYVKEHHSFEKEAHTKIVKGMGRKQLYELFAHLGYNSGIEVGVQRGRNAYIMFETIPNLHLHLVDPYKNHNFGYKVWDVDVHARFKQITKERLWDKDYWVISEIHKFGEDAFRDIPDMSVDFVYIDGDHSYEFVMLDLILWSRKVKRNGIIAGHDYGTNPRHKRTKPKVTRAVDDYVNIHGLGPIYVTDTRHREITGDMASSFFFVNGIKRDYAGKKRHVNLERKKPTVGILQYTDNSGDQHFMQKCRDNLLKCAKDNFIDEIVCVSHKPVENFGKNIVMEGLKREPASIFKQMVEGLENMKSDVVFFTEHDMIYHPSHFDFVPPEEDVFYYDMNRWSVDEDTGEALFYYTDVPSMMCGYREHLLKHYKRVRDYVNTHGYSGKFGYSPPKGLPKDKRKGTRQSYVARFGSMDVRREESYTRKRMEKHQFRGKNSNRGWKKVDQIPGWEKTKGRFKEFVDAL